MSEAETKSLLRVGIEHELAGRVAEAEKIYRRLLIEAPQQPDVPNLLGSICAKSDRMEEAEELFRRAVRLNGDFAEYHKNLAAACRRLGKTDEAIAEARRAIELEADYAEAYLNLASALIDAGRQGEAAAAMARTLEIRPDYAEAHYNLAIQLLLHGDFERGWKEYEWRTRLKSPIAAREFSAARWDGGDLGGKTILLWGEQGLGDVIQFVRYVPRVLERGAKVVLEVFMPLVRLFQHSVQGVKVAIAGQPLPSFDVHFPILSLPLALGTTLAAIPAPTPYLAAPAELVRLWGRRFNDGGRSLRVGLVWAGRRMHINDRNRSMRLNQLAGLKDIAGASFYSLQKGPPRAQIADGAFAGRLIDWTDQLDDFADTAGLMANLDLVITVDTAVAHLAGAIGKRTWLLLSTPPDWRWLLERSDSPWYPTMQLFRRNRADDWSGVIASVAEALGREIDSRRSDGPATSDIPS
ncbi:MAG: tetratricopeptide repeat-containing glycosyltransferase family protein [Tepidisphaeraceae bacterium]